MRNIVIKFMADKSRRSKRSNNVIDVHSNRGFDLSAYGDDHN